MWLLNLYSLMFKFDLPTVLNHSFRLKMIFCQRREILWGCYLVNYLIIWWNQTAISSVCKGEPSALNDLQITINDFCYEFPCENFCKRAGDVGNELNLFLLRCKENNYLLVRWDSSVFSGDDFTINRHISTCANEEMLCPSTENKIPFPTVQEAKLGP